jgi:hypothetical protein
MQTAPFNVAQFADYAEVPGVGSYEPVAFALQRWRLWGARAALGHNTALERAPAAALKEG